MSTNKFNFKILTSALMLAILFTISLPSDIYADSNNEFSKNVKKQLRN